VRALTVCVVCGSKRVRRQRVSVRLRNGQTITGVEADVCPNCGERYYDLETMHRLEAAGHGAAP
jgi:YgiT-type zinc finger domain-containing protein